MPEFKPIRQPRVSEEVSDQLKQAILEGEFLPGEKLPSEQRLAEQFQVSRLSIREAIHKLEHFGFVVTRQGVTGGAYVIDLTFQTLTNGFVDLFMAGKVSIPELTQLRAVIEPEVARLAALSITPDGVGLLEKAYLAEKSPPKTIQERWERRTGIHFALAQICGNRFFEAIVKSVLELTFQYVKRVDIGQEHLGRVHSIEMHRPVIEAVVAGDPKKAYDAMKTHAIEFGEVLLDLEKIYRKKTSGSET
jgi:GntR family transcriptional regulator, transcriptional repressor for pyruvate dehydrogenase complex